MQITEMKEIRQNLWAINELDKVTMYLVNGKEEALLLDTGLGITDLKQVIQEICGNKRIKVVNTHAHFDHNSGNSQFEQVYVGRFDEPFSHAPVGSQERAVIENMYFTDLPECEFDKTKWRPGAAETIKRLKDGDLLDIGGYIFKVLEIPSHSVGSIALLEENMNWLFTGDVLLTWEVWGHLGVGMLSPSATLREYRESIIKLSYHVNKDTSIFPSHGKRENMEGYSQYQLSPDIIDIYLDGIAKLIEGDWHGEPYESYFPNGLVKKFQVGGIVYDKNRIG